MKNRKSLIALLLVAIVGLVGLTIAYFANSTSVSNLFTTKEYETTYTESFVSPDNWLPGDTTSKSLVVENTGEVDQAVRLSYTESWTTHNNGTLNGWIHANGTKSTHESASELSTDERVAILNLANTDEWTKVGNYYYYNYKLAPTETTSSFLESVTFNSKTKLDDTCTTTTNNGVTTTTCNSSGDDYDDATYTLTITVETVQYNKYNEAWNLNNTVTIAASKPVATVTGATYLINNATNASDAQYGVSTKSNMFVFSHAATSQTTALTDYRYIGDAPNNYVKFNCDNDGTNCETWRILGVFSVDDGTGNFEQRIKLVRGNAFADGMSWDENEFNDWTNASLKTFLNGDYYNRSGDAADYGLKASAKSMIDNAVFYLGAGAYDDGNYTYGTAEEIYAWERGTETCVTTGNCEEETRSTQWTGKVGLMYPSDEYMVYGKGVDTTCYNNPRSCYDDNDVDPTTGWVYNSNIIEGEEYQDYTWLLSPYSSDAYYSSVASSDGDLGGKSGDNGLGVRPTVYLSADVEIASGTGTELDPYVLQLGA